MLLGENVMDSIAPLPSPPSVGPDYLIAYKCNGVFQTGLHRGSPVVTFTTTYDHHGY